ncbi:MAG: 50S ribosomal protein L5 [Bdellovibrionaceae bacterium]|nr:50S ribosomal protein L5 [Pseudobdellovibrionaceae bacterium]
MSLLLKDYKERIVPEMMRVRGYRNVNEVPKLQKVVVNCCVASSSDVKAALEDAEKELLKITGQKPIRTKAKQSISNFRLRENMEIGLKVTLRGRSMYEFLLRLLCIALPRIRDFRGVSPRAFDGRGAYTLGIKDHTIFPEIELDKVKRTIGMDVTFVTTARNAEETKQFLSLLGVPFTDRHRQAAAAAAAATKN